MATFLMVNGTAFIEFENSYKPTEKLTVTLVSSGDSKIALLEEGFDKISETPFVLGINKNPKLLHDIILENKINMIVVNDELAEPLKFDVNLHLKFDSISFIQDVPYKKPRKLAAFTHVYNEDVMLSLWIKYYGSLVGLENLYIIDHGSTNGINKKIPSGVNFISIPRGDCDHWNMAKYCGYFQRFLLTQYDWVIHTDCDEFVMVSDDNNFDKILDNYKNQNLKPAHAYNVIFDEKTESPINYNDLILKQRSLMTFDHSFQKCCLTSSPITWGPGFHKCYDKTTELDELWLFHLKFADADEALKRNTSIWQTLEQSELDKKFFHLSIDSFYNAKTENEINSHSLVDGAKLIPNWAKLYF